MVKFGDVLAVASSARGRRPVYGPGNPAGKRSFIANVLGAAKKAAMKTKTATQLVHKKKKQQEQMKPLNNPGGIVTQSYFSASKRAGLTATIRKRASAPNFRIANSANSFEALSGFQGASIYSAHTQGRLQEILNNMPSQIPSGNATRRFLLEKTSLKTIYTNVSSASCVLELYDITAKQDCDINPLPAWQNGVGMQTSTSPNAWSILGSKPWHSVQFKQFFQVVRRKTINLAAGASHQHNVTLRPNRLMNEQRIVENACYKGLTYFTLAVVKGVPVCDNNGVPRLVSTAPITVDVVQEYSIKYRWISDIDMDIYFTNNMITLANPENMNVFQGLPAIVTKAA